MQVVDGHSTHRADILMRRPWLEPSFGRADQPSKVPTMLTDEECRMLLWVGRYLFSGKGSVCELGPFMGGSTVHLAHGVASNGWRTGLRGSISNAMDRLRGRKWIHSFDTFSLPDSVKRTVLDYWHFPDFEGTDLLPVFRRYTARYRPLIEPHKGDVKDAIWREPIEILFVDCCKGWGTNDAVAQLFYPFLVPGLSIIIQQDYLHFQHPWVIATMEALYPRVKPVAHTAENSMIFACYEATTRDDIARATGMVGQIENVIGLISRAQERFEDPRVKEYLAQHITALRKNPSAQASWDLQL